MGTPCGHQKKWSGPLSAESWTAGPAEAYLWVCVKQPEPQGAWGGIDAYLQRHHMAKWLTSLWDMNEGLAISIKRGKKNRVTVRCFQVRHATAPPWQVFAWKHISSHSIAPIHCTDAPRLEKLFLPSENTQSTPVHQTLEAHVTSMLSQMRNLQPLVPSPRGCRIVA